MGLCEILTVAFLILKAIGVGWPANWSWFQCCIPEIIAVGIYAVMLICYVIGLICLDKRR